MKPTLAIIGIIACVVCVWAGVIWAGVFIFREIGKKVASTPPPFEHCVGKVAYLHFSGGLFGSPAVVTKVRPDGKIWTCGGV